MYVIDIKYCPLTKTANLHSNYGFKIVTKAGFWELLHISGLMTRNRSLEAS